MNLGMPLINCTVCVHIFPLLARILCVYTCTLFGCGCDLSLCAMPCLAWVVFQHLLTCTCVWLWTQFFTVFSFWQWQTYTMCSNNAKWRSWRLKMKRWVNSTSTDAYTRTCMSSSEAAHFSLRMTVLGELRCVVLYCSGSLLVWLFHVRYLCFILAFLSFLLLT